MRELFGKKAVVRYTLDGSDPNYGSEVYSEPISVYRNTVVKAVAMKGKRIVSEVATLDVHVKVDTPTASKAAGSYLLSQSVILCHIEGSSMYITTDGSTPSSSNTVESKPITVDHTMTIKAIAVKEGCDDSDVAVFEYKIGFEYGARGPAGGYMFYDCDEDNDDTNDGAGPDGLKSSVCGWQYLEAAPYDLHAFFGLYRKTPTGTNLFVNDSTTYSLGTSDPADGRCTGTEIGTGKANTAKLVAKMGSAAYQLTDYPDTTDTYAAKLCDEFVCGGYSDWFLPSKDELNLIYTNLHRNGFGNFYHSYYWSSSECSRNTASAWSQDFRDGRTYWDSREYGGHERAVRAF